jgi:hypothetical protein
MVERAGGWGGGPRLGGQEEEGRRRGGQGGVALQHMSQHPSPEASKQSLGRRALHRAPVMKAGTDPAQQYALA